MTTLAAPVPNSDAAPAPVAPSGRLGTKRLLAVNAFWFGNGAHWQPIFGSLLPTGALLVVAGSSHDADILVGRATSAGGVFALLVPVLVGFLSDRTVSRFGRRRPWMVAGTVVNTLGLFFIAVAISPLWLILAYLLLQASNNVAGAAYSGVIPDVVPVPERGTASGLLGMMNAIGTGVGLLLITITFGIFGDTRAGVIAGYAVIAVLLTGSLVVTCLGTPEHPVEGKPLRPGVPSPKAIVTVLSGLVAVSALLAILCGMATWSLGITVLGAGALSIGLALSEPGVRHFFRPFADRDFFWVFATRTLTQMGIFSIVPFVDVYFRDVVGAGDHAAFETSLWLLCVLVAGILPAILGGRISDRIGKRKRFVYFAGGIQAAVTAVLLFGLVSWLPLLYVLGVVFGVGYGLYYAVDWALACDVLTDGGAEAGKDMALWHVSLTLPQVIMPGILGGVLAYLNENGHHVAGVATGGNLGYRLIFGTSALWFVIGTVTVSLIRKVR